MNAFIYIMTNNTNDVLYIGVTSNLTRRIYQHQNHLIKGFTATYNLTKLVYIETCNNIVDAIRREKQLKTWHRAWKRELISQQNPHWKDLSKNTL